MISQSSVQKVKCPKLSLSKFFTDRPLAESDVLFNKPMLFTTKGPWVSFTRLKAKYESSCSHREKSKGGLNIVT